MIFGSDLVRTQDHNYLSSSTFRCFWSGTSFFTLKNVLIQPHRHDTKHVSMRVSAHNHIGLWTLYAVYHNSLYQYASIRAILHHIQRFSVSVQACIIIFSRRTLVLRAETVVCLANAKFNPFIFPTHVFLSNRGYI
jgi:hypothetical protein